MPSGSLDHYSDLSLNLSFLLQDISHHCTICISLEFITAFDFIDVKTRRSFHGLDSNVELHFMR